MDDRTRELIAIGASVAAHCQPCLAFHVGRARKLRLDKVKIGEAIEVGYMIEKGAMAVMKKHVGLVFKGARSKGVACCSDGDSHCCG